jgi:hypothetical protein
VKIKNKENQFSIQIANISIIKEGELVTGHIHQQLGVGLCLLSVISSIAEKYSSFQI